MVPRLFEEVEQVFAGHELEHEQQERRVVEHAVEGDDVRVIRQRMVYLSLHHSKARKN